MNLEQLMAWNGKIPFHEYESLVKKLESKNRSLRNACMAVQNEEDSLSVLVDEKESERWLRHEKKAASC